MNAAPAPFEAPTRAKNPQAATLALALEGERRLLDDLAATLGRQREAVGRNDLPALDDTVFGAHRILLNLTQARRRRRALLQLVSGREDLPLSDLPLALGEAGSEEVRRAVQDLQEAATALALELRRNHRVLEGAISAGDRLIRALCGGEQGDVLYAPPDGTPRKDAGGRLLDMRG